MLSWTWFCSRPTHRVSDDFFFFVSPRSLPPEWDKTHGLNEDFTSFPPLQDLIILVSVSEDSLKDSRKDSFLFPSVHFVLLLFICLSLCISVPILTPLFTFIYSPHLSLPFNPSPRSVHTSICPSCSPFSSIMTPKCRISWLGCLLVALVVPAVRSSFPRSGGSSAECGPGKADCPGETHLNTPGGC